MVPTGAHTDPDLSSVNRCDKYNQLPLYPSDSRYTDLMSEDHSGQSTPTAMLKIQINILCTPRKLRLLILMEVKGCIHTEISLLLSTEHIVLSFNIIHSV